MQEDFPGFVLHQKVCLVFLYFNFCQVDQLLLHQFQLGHAAIHFGQYVWSQEPFVMFGAEAYVPLGFPI